MLYLNPPFIFINGVSLFRDYANDANRAGPLQYYYLPVAPRLTRRLDPATGQRIPQFQLVRYRGRAGNGGLLNFDVDLGLEPGQLEEIRDELKRMERLREAPNLAPVPLSGGTVKLLMLGQESGGASDDDETPPKFVVKMSHHANPALYADNQAAFSVALDQEGVSVMEKALAGELAPIGVVYSLEYHALRPAYSVRLHADWERVQKHFDEHFGVNTPFFSADIDKAVDKLIDERAIVIEADTFVPEGEDGDGIIGRRDEALNQVRDMVTDAFFEPSLDPFQEKEDGWDRAARFLERLAPINHSRGDNALFTYKKMDYTRIDKKLLNVTINERTTVKRNIYPQGHLGGFFRAIRQEGLNPDDFVISVDLDDKWFERRRVKAIARANFQEDSIASLSVNLRYGDEPKNIILDPAAPQGEVDWASIVEGDVMRRDVAASYRVTFKDVDGSERPVSLVSPEQTVDVDNLEINPRELYAIVQVPIVALDFPWDRYPALEVRTRYSDDQNGVNIGDSFLLKEKEHEKLWKMFARDPRRTGFQYKLIYRAANHKDVELPWVDSQDEAIIARDPFPAKRTLTIVPSFNWLQVDRAFVDAFYEDEASGVFEEQSFEFSELDAEPKVFSVDLRNPDMRQIAYQLTVLYKDGRIEEVPRSFTLDRRAIVRAGMKGHRIVVVRPAPLDFARKRLKRMVVSLRSADIPNGIEVEDEFDFSSTADRAHFEFDYIDPQRAIYEYQVRYHFLNGLARTTTWKRESSDELFVPVG